MIREPEKFDLAIIGAGVIGLAIAAALSTRYPAGTIVLIEQNETFGQETSSRNSEVIHAGIYYPARSLKARHCVKGRALLYEFCHRRGVKFNRCGKLIVANNPAEEQSLVELADQAAANGVDDLVMLTAAQVNRLEPNIRASAALLSPSTGVIDSHGLMACLEQLAIQGGVLPAYCHRLTGLDRDSQRGEYLLHLTNPDGSPELITSEIVINCAGLQADRVAEMAGIDCAAAGYRQQLCKGEYFSLPPAKAALVSGLVYPPPLQELAGLGIHATKTLDGRLRLGPNTVYIDRPEYTVDPGHAGAFYRAVKSFLPFVRLEDLAPEMAGIRPKLSGPGEPFRDFVIHEEKDRDLPGLINLIGLESPGLTSALSIAQKLARGRFSG